MKTNDTKAIDEGRMLQFQAMMDQLAAMQSRYKGVRGELLAKVREELMRCKPTPGGGGGGERADNGKSSDKAPPAPTSSPPSASVHQLSTARASAGVQMLPSCRLCGRGMKLSNDGLLVCAKGHTRHVA
ncbi:MAG: hypothetical protein AB1938_20585 [Myxococcota bacterium]